MCPRKTEWMGPDFWAVTMHVKGRDTPDTFEVTETKVASYAPKLPPDPTKIHIVSTWHTTNFPLALPERS